MKNKLTVEDYEAILEVMNQFDANRVAKAMKALDWYWYSVDNIPDCWDVNRKATEMLKKVAEEATHEGITHSSGGLCVKGVRIDGKLYLELKFVLEWADNYE